MILSPFRSVCLAVAGTLLLVAAAPGAKAVEERGWLSLEAGSNLYDAEQRFRDGTGLGLRGTGFLNRWMGLEGLFHTASPSTETRPIGDASYSHYAVGLVLTPDRNAWVLPYLYGGLGSARSGYDGGPSSSQRAHHAGVGVLLRAGERLGIRIDARDVTYGQVGGPGRDTRVHVLQISSGVSASWFGRPRDTDEDGVPNKRDRSPATPRGAVVDASGTPLDADKDLVFDGIDTCPGTPEGAVVDSAGCPVDSDGDAVPDGIDKCADTAKGVVVDAAGCGVDSDGDGVFDGPERCAETPRGSVVNPTGCPLDADGDGIPDGIDTCPATPAGVAVNAGGCAIEPLPYERQMLENWLMRLTDVGFAPDSARILPEGTARLDSIGVVLLQWPMLKFEVGIHSDNQGETDRRFQLTRFRGRAVVQHIAGKFPSLNSKNYWFTGYGDSEPLASNATPAGRAINRRIEFKRLN